MSDSPKDSSGPLQLAGTNWNGIEPPTGEKRERMEHIDKVLQNVWRRDRGQMKLPTAEVLGEPLGVGEKTIRRLIREMQDKYGIPIDFVPERFGYLYREAVAFSPILQLTESDLVALYLMQKVGIWDETKWQNSLKVSFQKVLGLFGKSLSFDPALLDECFSFDTSGPRAKFRPAHLDTCSRAMLRQEELILTYTKQYGEGAGIPEIRRVRPLHITYRDFAFYVLCWDLKAEDVRLFMVTRMNAVEETRVKFERPRDFDPRTHLDRAFKLYASKELVKVVLHFSAEAAWRATERRWHSTQRLKRLKDGGVLMTLRVGLAPDLYAWIGGFFGDCRAVKPSVLQRTMKQLFLEGAARY